MDFIARRMSLDADGVSLVTPLPIQDSGMLTALAQRIAC